MYNSILCIRFCTWGERRTNQDNLVLSTWLITWIGHRKEIRKTAFKSLNGGHLSWLLYIELTLFRLAQSAQWIFEISARDAITADYTIIMSRTLKVTGNHVKFARFVLLAVGEEVKTWLPFFFVQCIINQGLGKGYQASPKLQQ